MANPKRQSTWKIISWTFILEWAHSCNCIWCWHVPKPLLNKCQTLALACISKQNAKWKWDLCASYRGWKINSASFWCFDWPISPAQSHCTHLQGYLINSQSTHTNLNCKHHSLPQSFTHLLLRFIDDVSVHAVGQYENVMKQFFSFNSDLNWTETTL